MGSYDFLRETLVSEFGVREQAISADASLESLGMDSLSMAELIREVEEEYGIVLADEDAAFSTLGEAAAIVDALVNESKG